MSLSCCDIFLQVKYAHFILFFNVCVCVCLCGVFFAVQLHAEVCYAECQLQRAALTFLQVHKANDLFNSRKQLEFSSNTALQCEKSHSNWQNFVLNEPHPLQCKSSTSESGCFRDIISLFLFLQDENMVSFIKGGIKVRNSYLIYK